MTLRQPGATLTSDAFAHLPALRDRVTPAQQSALRVTPDVLAQWDERARALGQPENWRLSEQQIEDSRRAVLGNLASAQDLWIFGYGSLMWDPGVHFAEVRLAALQGYERRFNFRTVLGRGTPQRPALMLSLEPAAGCCKGLAFRIAADLAEAESVLLWRREMIRGGYCPLMLALTTPQGNVTALVFASNRAHASYAGGLSLHDSAAIIATACGVIGSNRDYLERLAAQLAALQIEDSYVERLLEQVRRLGAT